MKKKITVMDDEEDSLTLMGLILSRNGYDVKTDLTGAVLDSINDENTDLLILDINLGYKNGKDICRELKLHPNTRDIPVILTSAIKELPEISEACGAKDYLGKPFISTDLLGKVKTSLFP